MAICFFLLACISSECSDFFVLQQLCEVPIAPAQVLTTVMVAAFNYVVYQRLVFHE